MLKSIQGKASTFLIFLPQRLLPNAKIKWLLLPVLLVVLIRYTLLMGNCGYLSRKSFQLTDDSQRNLLDGCRYVYIDMGTNIGIQIRKLYEPNLYPDAPVLPLFKKVFGNNTSEVCSVGFEANPLHTDYLKEFENYCLRRNWRVKIFTSTAVSITEKNVTFYTEPGNEENNQLGASLIKSSNFHTENVTVPSIDIVSWFKTTVIGRKIPREPPASKVMIKTDIEGHDSAVLTNFIFGGVYCTVDLIFGEHMTHDFLNAISMIQRHANSCKTELIYMDDESYYNRRFPFTTNKSLD